MVLAYRYFFFIYIDRANSWGPASLMPRYRLQPQLVKNGEILIVSLTQLFIANSARGSQSTQLSQVKLTKARRYLFIAALTILVQLSILGCYAELGFRVTFKRQFRRRQKLEINKDSLLETIVLRAPYSLQIVQVNTLTSSLVSRLVTEIKCLIFFLFLFFNPLYYTTYNTAHAASRLWRYSSIYMNPLQAA